MIRVNYSLLICLVSANISTAQEVYLSNPTDIYPDSYVQVTDIDTQTGQIMRVQSSNILSSYGYFGKSNNEFSGSGKYLRNEKRIFEKLNANYDHIMTPYEADTKISSLSVSQDEKLFILHEQSLDDGETQVTLKEIDNNVSALFSFPTRSFFFQSNYNASLFVYVYFGIHILEKKNDAFGETIVKLDDMINNAISCLLVSGNGGRIIFKSGFNYKYLLYYIDREPDGWSSPKTVPIRDRTGNDVIFNQDLQGMIHGITYDGKTILYYDKECKPALIHEDNGIWSEPEYIEFQEFNVFGGYKDRYLMSRDGEIIAAQKMVEERGGVAPYLNVYLLTKSTDESWMIQKINPDGTLVVPDVYLTDDGSQLFWLPESKSSISNTNSFDKK